MDLNETNKEEISIIPYDNLSLKEEIISSSKLDLPELVELKDNQINDFKIRSVFCEGRIYFVIKDTYVKLGVKDPGASGRIFQYNHRDKFLPESFRKFEINTPKGRRTYLTATYDVISCICSRANSDIAFDYLKAVGKLYQKLFEGELSLVPSQEAINLYLQEQQFKTSLIEKRLDQVTSALNQINTSLKQFQIDNQIETSILPETGTIGKKQSKNLQILFKNIAKKEGVHFNRICTEFKEDFGLWSYKDLPRKYYRTAISWLNKRQDKEEQEKKLVSKKVPNLLNFIEQPKEDMEGSD